ncbi:transmembrane protein 117 [Biomphalaria glabrata]|uniref:Transmembrane protein 117-like n=1 Tax=Biomphalaria glabrata TaxID=6526 RepID=A0A9U8DX77_BIOGL|nr:transmembrane protein 117-like [Biomphalaria glabrata]XP_013064237.2 transmembrane protein 117-like [Biomphalaria glabrata]XP_013064238.2 transmembrane protein 117-like [Biomphalaria glabrata]KAI8761024.1 transmembrane protein 117-like [Biomphalaria glabrata]
MWKLNRKKVTDECSLAEKKPLKIVGEVSEQDKLKGEGDNVKMKDESHSEIKEAQEEPKEESDQQPSCQNKVSSAEMTEQFSGKKIEQPIKSTKSKEDIHPPHQDVHSEGVEIVDKPHPPFKHSFERLPSLEIATKDDVDAGSIYSLIMKHDFRYHFQHPYFRMFTAYFVTFCNFLIYAEDPVAHSRSECNIPVIGNDFSFVFMKWFPNSWSVLKAFMWFSGIIVGLIAGKVIFHTFLFNHLLRLKMFHDDKGTWMTMFLSTVLSVFIFSYLYNALLMIGGDHTAPYAISTYMGITNSAFMKAAATGTWCGDFFTAWMVTDIMLQEKLYPGWATLARKWWNTNMNRIIVFWIAVSMCSFIVLFVIATDYINWDRLNHDFLHSNELSRSFLASFILVLDITIVMQDWDFPHFVGAIDIKLPGVNASHVRFKIPKLLRKLEYWHIHISGKWFNYGILFIVILLDLNMWKNQMFYAPYDYGQYIDDYGRIYTVLDSFSLNNANKSILTFYYRNSTINPDTGNVYALADTRMNSRYNGYSLGLKGLAFVPSLAIFLIFGLMVAIYGRRPKPTQENPYAGRLLKRRRNKFNGNKKWSSLRAFLYRAMPLTNRLRKKRFNTANEDVKENVTIEMVKDESDYHHSQGDVPELVQVSSLNKM